MLCPDGDFHHSQPRLLSVTQSTEYGTTYSLQEIKALADIAHKHNMFLHMDGARIYNAAAHLGCSLKELTIDAGVDVRLLSRASSV
jgi:threonine aldolase